VTAFDDFLTKHGWLLDRSALSAFYSSAHLSSEAARRGWADPDQMPFPCLSPGVRSSVLRSAQTADLRFNKR
jgi:hypothetical protein